MGGFFAFAVILLERGEALTSVVASVLSSSVSGMEVPAVDLLASVFLSMFSKSSIRAKSLALETEDLSLLTKLLSLLGPSPLFSNLVRSAFERLSELLPNVSSPATSG